MYNRFCALAMHLLQVDETQCGDDNFFVNRLLFAKVLSKGPQDNTSHEFVLLTTKHWGTGHGFFLVLPCL
jgi:hypothetical protein